MLIVLAEHITPANVAWGIVAAIVGYFIGAINPAAIIARARGIDLKSSGSGNPGATNAGRVMGKRAGIIVGLLDVLKGFLPALFFSLTIDPAVGALAGLAAIIGHITSPFLRGRGGKGVATTAGVLLAIEPWWLLVVLVCFAIVKLTLKQTGIASVAGAFGLVVVAIVDDNDIEMSIFGVLIGLLVIVRHQRNIRAAWVDWRARKPTPKEPAE